MKITMLLFFLFHSRLEKAFNVGNHRLDKQQIQQRNPCLAGNCTQNVYAILLGRYQARGRNDRKAHVDLGDDRLTEFKIKFFKKIFIVVTLIYNII